MLGRTNKKITGAVWLALALLAHFLLFVGVTLQFTGRPVPVDEEDKALPAYIYHDDTPRPTPDKMPDTTELTPPPQQQAAAAAAEAQEEIVIDPDGTARTQKPNAKPALTPQQQQDGQTKSFNYKTPMGAINFKADNQVDRPLLRILSKATAAKLYFPKIAQDFYVTGTAKIRFLITPEGVISDITLIQSSGAGVLDQAGLDTINAISPVKGVGPYLKEPQYVVVALVYG